MGISICERNVKSRRMSRWAKGFHWAGLILCNCRFRSVHPWRLCGGTCDRKAGEMSCRKHDTQSAPRVIHNGSFQHVIKWLFSSVFCRCGSWIRTFGFNRRSPVTTIESPIRHRYPLNLCLCSVTYLGYFLEFLPLCNALPLAHHYRAGHRI